MVIVFFIELIPSLGQKSLWWDLLRKMIFMYIYLVILIPRELNDTSFI
jgi:hypothetical protein